jgi:regulator of PEP synthase PpsR (kinase-PPPase family)
MKAMRDDHVRIDGLHLADVLLLSICRTETDPDKLFEAVKTWRRARASFEQTEKSND